MESLRFLGIIPARYASTRFPGKPLALLGGKPVIQHVCERMEGLLDDFIVATDDERIRHAVTSFGGRAVMTSTSHRSGTDRCWEAYQKYTDESRRDITSVAATFMSGNGTPYDVVVNIQGDEPFIAARQIEAIKQCFSDPSTQIATLVKPFHPEDGIEKLLNPNSPKVVVDKNMRALYFSRSVIPYLRDTEQAKWLSHHTFYKHIGLYAYRTQTLQEITSLPQGTLEKAESLEQLRWLENGYVIKVGVCDVETIGIDTPEDLRQANELLNNSK